MTMNKKKENEIRTNQQDFVNAVSKLVVNGRSQMGECFDVFLDLHLQFFCNNVNERQKYLFEYMKKDDEFRDNLILAMRQFGDLSMNYHDALGELFTVHITKGEHGQFFTPENITYLMTQIAMPDRKARNVYDCACGSGRTLLSALRQAREQGKEILCYGNDISMTCSKMTLLNLLVNSAGGEVTCGNALLSNTDTFTFFHIDQVKHYPSGRVMSTYWQYNKNNVDEVNKEREEWWLRIAKFGWLKYYPVFDDETPKDEKETQPLSTDVEYQKDSNGQLTLF